MPLGFEIGGRSMFVAGVEWGSPSSLIYVQERPKNAEGLFSLSFPRFGIFDP